MNGPPIPIPTNVPLHLTITLADNQVRLGDKVSQFTRRWEAFLLLQLLIAHRRGQLYAKEQLHHALRLQGQPQPLTRQQLLRVWASLQQFFAHIEGISLHHPPHKASSGPWQLHMRKPYTWEVQEQQNDARAVHAATGARDWPHALITVREAADVGALLALLECLVRAECAAKNSDRPAALAQLETVAWDDLSDEAQALYRLRQIKWLRRDGQLERALAHARAFVQEPRWQKANPNLVEYVRFLMHRIRYDRHPAQVWPELLEQSYCPVPQVSIYWQSRSEWHNLQALLHRRATLECYAQTARKAKLHPAPQSGQQPVQQVEARAAAEPLHLLALQHYQAALYGALHLQNWDRCVAYSLNLAFHLQKMLSLGLSQHGEVYKAYSLSLLIAEKLDSGYDDIWDLVFFGQYWLEHQASITQELGEDLRAISPLNFHPQDMRYWQALIERSTATNDPRLRAIIHLTTLQMAQLHRDETEAAKQHETLSSLLKERPSLISVLESDGYDLSSLKTQKPPPPAD